MYIIGKNDNDTYIAIYDAILENSFEEVKLFSDEFLEKF